MYIFTIDVTLTGTTSPGERRPGSKKTWIGASLSDGLLSYLGHLLGVASYPSADMQSAYSSVPADWGTTVVAYKIKLINNLVLYATTVVGWLGFMA